MKEKSPFEKATERAAEELDGFKEAFELAKELRGGENMGGEWIMIEVPSLKEAFEAGVQRGRDEMHGSTLKYDHEITKPDFDEWYFIETGEVYGDYD